jgi:hypothetical protein
MTQTFTQDVFVDGTQDAEQLRVQGHTTQTDPLQTWENSAGDPLAQISGDGRLQVGDIGMTTPDALIEAHRENAAMPQRGIHSLGRISGALSDAVSWVVGELELLGTGGVSGLQTALRARLTHSNSGDSTEAELRAGDFETINDGGSSGDPVGSAVGMRAAVTNTQDAYLDEAVGLEVAIAQEAGGSGEIAAAFGVRVADVDSATDNYALYTGKGLAHFGDVVEMKRQTAMPGTPDTDIVRLYPKSDGKVYAKDWNGVEYDLTGGWNSGSSTDITGTAGEALSERDYVYLKPSDSKWYKVDITGTPVAFSLLRAFVIEPGGISADGSGNLRLEGTVEGFASLTPGAVVYADDAGAVTQTAPEPVLDGDQVIIVTVGMATSATEIAIAKSTASYVKLADMSEDDFEEIEHHSISPYARYATWRKALPAPASLMGSATASANGSFSGYPPSNAIDGYNGTTWSNPNTAAGWFLVIDLGSAQIATRLRLMSPGGGSSIGAFVFQGSATGAWGGEETTLVSNTHSAGSGVFVTYDFVNSTPYRYYRVYPTAGGWHEVAEIQILGMGITDWNMEIMYTDDAGANPLTHTTFKALETNNYLLVVQSD